LKTSYRYTVSIQRIGYAVKHLMGRPREHDDTTRAALLDAAEGLLASGGLSALSVRAVAAAVGTTTRAVYSVFGGRPGLIGALYARAFQILGGLLDEIPTTEDPCADLVRCGVEGFRRFALVHPNLFRLSFERLDPDFQPGPAEGAAALRTLDKLRERVHRCHEAGRLGDHEVAAVTWQFHACAQGLASVELQGWLPAGGDHAVFWCDALAALVAGYAHAPHRARGAGRHRPSPRPAVRLARRPR
jgi:AcrR family transcriptional regulator